MPGESCGAASLRLRGRLSQFWAVVSVPAAESSLCLSTIVTWLGRNTSFDLRKEWQVPELTQDTFQKIESFRARGNDLAAVEEPRTLAFIKGRLEPPPGGC